MRKQISPLQSQALGLIVSGVVGLIVMVTVWKLIAYIFDFWYIGMVLGPAVGLVLGGISAFRMFTGRRFEIPLNWVGVQRRFGKLTDGIYENGDHWVSPFSKICITPGSTEKLRLRIPGEKIDAQDGTPIYFGLSEDENEKNLIQYSVIGPILYIAVDKPETELREEYLEQARLFFGQASDAVGVKNEKTLFSEFIMLPYGDSPEEKKARNDFETDITSAMFRTDDPSACGAKELPLFTEKSVKSIMKKAGTFRRRAAEEWGIGKIIAFNPNVRENPETEAAATKKKVAQEEMNSAKTKMDQIKTLVQEMVATNKISPDLAATLVAGVAGQKVDIKNETFNVPGLTEAVLELGKIIINKTVKTKARRNI